MDARPPKKAKSISSQFATYQRMRGYITELTPDSVYSILSGGSSSAFQQTRLFETIIARDSEVRGAVSQRNLALSAGTWEFVESDEGNKQKRASKRLIKVLKKVRGLKAAIRHLGKFPLFGYAVVEIVYDDKDPGVPVELVPVPYAALDCRAGEIFISVKGQWQKVVDGEELRSRLIISKADVNDPPGEAAMRAVVDPFIIKRFAMLDWAVYSERLGVPPTIAAFKPGISTDSETQTPQDVVLGWLEQLRSHAMAAVPADLVEISLLEDARLDASRSFELLIDRCDRAMKRAILTSESTMQSGAEGQGARAADQVRAEYGLDTIIQSDGEVVAEDLQLQLVDRIAGYLDVEEGAVKVAVSWRKELPTAALITATCELKNAGFQFNERKALEDVGFEFVEEDSPDRAKPPEPEIGGFGEDGPEGPPKAPGKPTLKKKKKEPPDAS